MLVLPNPYARTLQIPFPMCLGPQTGALLQVQSLILFVVGSSEVLKPDDLFL